MRPVTIARNYAEALFDLGEQTGQTDQYGRLLDAVAATVLASPEVQTILTSPRVPKAEKARILGAALRDTPRPFVLFLQAVVKRGRQALLDEIAREYEALIDIKHNRIRAGVTLARTIDEKLREQVRAGLSRHFGKEVVAEFSVDPEILGGAVVRIGTRHYDGSLRRKLTMLRRQLLAPSS
ncbi:MAG TPA: ATP synthase F1 subunit delta [Gemmatimonadales bacterium]|nr:ATP synthase F1 subunit delta [Gemmatimonadales bacterium]